MGILHSIFEKFLLGWYKKYLSVLSVLSGAKKLIIANFPYLPGLCCDILKHLNHNKIDQNYPKNDIFGVNIGDNAMLMVLNWNHIEET